MVRFVVKVHLCIITICHGGLFILAAGITQLADEDNIYIVRANGNIAQPGGWFRFGSEKLLAEGDTIIVPVDYDYRQSLPFWRDVISIVYQGSVAIAAISGL